jgi:hypothetical protein
MCGSMYVPLFTDVAFRERAWDVIPQIVFTLGHYKTELAIGSIRLAWSPTGVGRALIGRGPVPGRRVGSRQTIATKREAVF